MDGNARRTNVIITYQIRGWIGWLAKIQIATAKHFIYSVVSNN